MLSPLLLLACASLLLPTGLAAPVGPSFSPNPAAVARNVLSKRNEPNTGGDLPDTPDHPNQLDQVETGFKDALQMAAYVLNSIDTDSNIFPHYFNEGDRAGVKNVFAAILGSTSVPPLDPTDGNALLGNILVQTMDTDSECDGFTLAYMGRQDTNSPFIVLCPEVFNKKAVTALNGADDPNDSNWYVSCDQLKAQGHVSYHMNSLGATLLHEYTHYDGLVKTIFGSEIIDQPNGYGPVNVYDKLDHAFSPFNADSYMYYALEVMWSERCPGSDSFGAPRPGLDDADPDCNGGCHN